MASTPFARWTASDVDLSVLNQHCGPSLKELGVSACELNLFKLFDCQRIVEAPALVIAAYLCPPFSYQQYLDELIRKYARFLPSANERRS